MRTTIFYYPEQRNRIHSVVRGSRYARLSSDFARMGLAVYEVPDDQSVPPNATHLEFGEDGVTARCIVRKERTVSYELLNIPKDVDTIVFDRGNLPGLGDYVMILSVIQIVREFFPNARLVFLGEGEKLRIFDGHPWLVAYSHNEFDVGERGRAPLSIQGERGRAPLSIQGERGDHDGFVVNLWNPCPAGKYETSHTVTRLSRNEIFAAYLGVPWRRERPRLYLTKQEMEKAQVRIGDSDAPKLGIALRSAEVWKDWPHVLDFARLARDEDYDVYLFDDEQRTIEDGLTSVVLPIREAMAVATLMNMMVTPDTAWFHLADALQIPCLALFGSIDGELHARKYRSRSKLRQREGYRVWESWCHILQGHCIHGTGPCMYDVCEGRTSYQPCLEGITPQMVLSEVQRLLKGKG